MISEELPEVASQIRTEVGRGTPRSEPSASARDWAFETFPGKVEPFKRGTDVGVRDYSADEQLAILVDALRTVAATMLESRQVLLQVFGSTENASDHGQIRVTFVDPARAESTASLGATDLAETQALVEATQKLTEALDAVRPRG
ncbi:hypothetical protein [Nocardia xishanensis]